MSPRRAMKKPYTEKQGQYLAFIYVFDRLNRFLL